MGTGKPGRNLNTKNRIISLIRNLPNKPDKKFFEGWEDITNSEAKKNSESRVFKHKETGLEVRFDPKKDGKPGFEGKDHWHVYNPNASYLDKDGNPTAKNSKSSHIINDV